METRVECIASEAKPLHTSILDSLRFALRRVADRVRLAQLRLTDLNGPRGGIDKRCQVQLQLQDNGTVVVNAVSSNWRQALSLALQRAIYQVFKRLGQSKRPLRRTAKRLPGLG